MSCDRSERIFDEPVADRIENNLQLYREALVARQTWIMEYFPDSQLRYGGWIYILQFTPDHIVNVWFDGKDLIPQ